MQSKELNLKTILFQVIPSSLSDLMSMVTDIPMHMKWAVLMSSGGHFAGAIFDRYETNIWI